MAHTPGPWKVVDRFLVWTDDDVGCEVARVCDENLDDDCLQQADADARLIAAAPELLAACKQLRDCLSDWIELADYDADVSQDIKALDYAIAAIAKAEGRGE